MIIVCETNPITPERRRPFKFRCRTASSRANQRAEPCSRWVVHECAAATSTDGTYGRIKERLCIFAASGTCAEYFEQEADTEKYSIDGGQGRHHSGAMATIKQGWNALDIRHAMITFGGNVLLWVVIAMVGYLRRGREQQHQPQSSSNHDALVISPRNAVVVLQVTSCGRRGRRGCPSLGYQGGVCLCLAVCCIDPAHQTVTVSWLEQRGSLPHGGGDCLLTQTRTAECFGSNLPSNVWHASIASVARGPDVCDSQYVILWPAVKSCVESNVLFCSLPSGQQITRFVVYAVQRGERKSPT